MTDTQPRRSDARDTAPAAADTNQQIRAELRKAGERLRADHDVWEAFREQRDEFADFYRSAFTALESYREVLEAYRTVKRTPAPLQRGDLERIQRDKHAHVKERDACLAALRDFQGKFSAMLAVFCPVPLP